MASEIRGAVDITAGGEVVAQIALTMNAICAYEDATGQTLFDALTAMEGGDISFRDLRQLIAVCIQGERMSLDQVGDLIDAAGIQNVIARFGDAAQLAFPAKKGKAPGK